MIVHAFRCETCKKEHPFTSDSLRPDYTQVPAKWIMVVIAGIMSHFCSRECLAQSLGVHPDDLEPAEQPQSTMRRFLLVDGETADEYEGVKFANGHVAVNGLPLSKSPFWFESWNALKEDCPGWGVTWIDREVSDATE